MRKTIVNIKNIIRIIIGVVVIFSMLKSCAKALTYEDIKSYVNQTAAYFPNNRYYQYINSCINGANTNGVNLINSLASGYSNVSLYCTNNKLDGFQMKAYNATSGIIYSTSSGLTYTGNYRTLWCINGTFQSLTNVSNESNHSIDGGYSRSTTSNDENNLWGMSYITQEISGTLPATFVGNQGLVPLVNIYFGNMFSTTITYNGEEMEANELDYNYRIEYIENVVTEDNEITSMVATLDNKSLEVQDLGSYWTIKENNSTTLKYNQIYNLNVKAIVKGNEEEIEEKVIFVPPGTTISGGVITNIPSGDYNFNTENATNQIIENQNQNQEDNQSFLQNLYNNLLQPSGEEIRVSLEETLNTLELPSGEKEMAMAGLDIITSNPNDFIISWTPKPTHFSIKGQQLQTQLQIETPTNNINFSQMERENEDLHEAMTYARAILSFSVFVLFFKDLWNTLMATLGVSTQVYEKDQEEKARINRVNERNEENIRNAYERQRYREWLRGHSK